MIFDGSVVYHFGQLRSLIFRDRLVRNQALCSRFEVCEHLHRAACVACVLGCTRKFVGGYGDGQKRNSYKICHVNTLQKIKIQTYVINLLQKPQNFHVKA